MIRLIIKIYNFIVIQMLNLSSFIFDFCNPSFYLKSLRIVKRKTLTEINSNIHVIFVIYQKTHIPFYVKNIIENVKKRNLVLSVVVNHDASKEIIEYLEKWSDRITIRKNMGRDFGCYKDEITSVDLQKIDRLILINDSVFYFNRNLDILFSDLLDPCHEWVCMYENFDYEYHAQSFLLAFGPSIIQSKLFKEYWDKYLPFNNRRHSIEAGEKGLTRVCKKIGYVPYVINSMGALIQRLLTLTNLEFIALIDNRWIKYGHHTYNERFKKMQKMQLSSRKYNDSKTNVVSNEVVHQLILAIDNSNPTHSAAQLFLELFDRPYIKRDVVFRDSVSIHQLKQSLLNSNLDQIEIEECINEARLKGSHTDVRGILSKIKLKYGFM